VDVQQHFNDLEMRVRNFAITVVGALIAAVGFTYQQSLQTPLLGHRFPTGVGLIVAAFFAWASFFFMDRFWYHVLLKGAVDHTTEIEARYNEIIPGIGLGKTISEASGGVRLFGIQLNSNRRLEGFYIVGFVMLTVILCWLLFATPDQKSTSSGQIGTQSQTAKPLQLPDSK
jgi:hypothetical protein